MVILITGCSQGLGRAMCRIYSRLPDVKLVITARSSLSSLRTEFPDCDRFIVRELDLLKPETFQPLVNEVQKRWGGVDVLINNAAVVYRAILEHVDDETEKRQMQTNYFAPRELIRLVAPGMRDKRAGKIINISSVSGMMAMPTMSSYSASKFALEGMSEALWYELKPFNVSVTLVQIGFVNSDSFKRSVLPKKALALKDGDIYKYYYSTMSHFIEKVMGLAVSNPESIATRIAKKIILDNNPSVRIFGTADAILFDIFRRVLPGQFYHISLYLLLPISWKIKIRSLLEYLDKKI